MSMIFDKAKMSLFVCVPAVYMLAHPAMAFASDDPFAPTSPLDAALDALVDGLDMFVLYAESPLGKIIELSVQLALISVGVYFILKMLLYLFHLAVDAPDLTPEQEAVNRNVGNMVRFIDYHRRRDYDRDWGAIDEGFILDSGRLPYDDFLEDCDEEFVEEYYRRREEEEEAYEQEQREISAQQWETYHASLQPWERDMSQIDFSEDKDPWDYTPGTQTSESSSASVEVSGDDEIDYYEGYIEGGYYQKDELRFQIKELKAQLAREEALVEERVEKSGFRTSRMDSESIRSDLSRYGLDITVVESASETETEIDYYEGYVEFGYDKLDAIRQQIRELEAELSGL